MSALRTSYAAAEQRTSNIAFWRPTLRSIDGEILRDAPTIRARARDLERNNPYAQHAIRISRIAVVGAKLRLVLRPDFRFLGLDHKTATNWAREFERIWEQYSHGTSFWIDAGRRMTFTDMFNLIHDQDFRDGEALVASEWDSARPWASCYQPIDVDRLSNPQGQPETDRLKGGVELGPLGEPLAYHIRNAHPAEHGLVMNPMAMATWSRVPRETAWHRPVMMHSYQHVRPGQTRGVSEFSAAIVSLKMGHEYQEMELATATAQASFAAVLTSAANVDEARTMVDDKIDPASGEIISAAQQNLAETIDYYNELDLRFNGVKVPKLAIGDKLDLVGSKHPTQGYAEFVRNQLYGVAAGLGVDPIALTQDYSKANYASNKMSFAHNGRAAETRRARLIRTVGMQIVMGFAEEAILRGAIDMPKGLTPEQFYLARDFLIKGTFITASRALIEPLKERQAQQLGRTLGVETMESICAEEGESWEDNLEQIARENAVASDLGLFLPGMAPPMLGGADNGQQPPPTADDDEEETDPPVEDSTKDDAQAAAPAWARMQPWYVPEGDSR